jgi:hypothetical protein
VTINGHEVLRDVSDINVSEIAYLLEDEHYELLCADGRGYLVKTEGAENQ